MNPYIVAGGVLAVVCAYGVGHWQGDDAGQASINSGNCVGTITAFEIAG